MTRFAILLCGHWIVDHHDVTRVGTSCPCPIEGVDSTVIARAVDPEATFMPPPASGERT